MTVAKNLKQLFTDTFFYGFGSALQGFIVFLLFPIYTRVLSQADYGAQDLILTAVTIVSYFVILGLDSGAARHYYDVDSSDRKKAVVSTWLWFEVIISIPIVALLIIFAEPICRLAFNDARIAQFFRLGVLTVPFTILTRVITLTLRLSFQAKRFSIVIGVGAFLQALTAILFVVVLQMGISGVFLAMIASNICQFLLGLIFVRDQVHFEMSRPLLKAMLRFGVPLLPASLMLWVLNYSNRYFLTRYATLEDIGLLSVGMRIANILVFFITAFQNAWPPFAYSLLNDHENARQTYSRVMTLFTTLTLFVAAGLVIFGREVIFILATKNYEQSSGVLPWLAFSTIAWGCVSIVGIGFSVMKKTYHISISAAIGAVVATVLNIVLIPEWGIIGAAIATLLGNVLALGYNYIAGQKYFPIPYEYRKIVTMLVLSIVFALLGQSADLVFHSWQPVLILSKAAMVAALALAVVLFRVITPDEIRTGMKGLRARFAKA